MMTGNKNMGNKNMAKKMNKMMGSEVKKVKKYVKAKKPKGK